MQKTIVPVIVWLGFDPFRPVQNHTGRCLTGVSNVTWVSVAWENVDETNVDEAKDAEKKNQRAEA